MWAIACSDMHKLAVPTLLPSRCIGPWSRPGMRRPLGRWSTGWRRHAWAGHCRSWCDPSAEHIVLALFNRTSGCSIRSSRPSTTRTGAAQRWTGSCYTANAWFATSASREDIEPFDWCRVWADGYGGRRGAAATTFSARWHPASSIPHCHTIGSACGIADCSTSDSCSTCFFNSPSCAGGHHPRPQQHDASVAGIESPSTTESFDDQRPGSRR